MMHILSEESAESNRGVRWRRQPPPAGLHSSGAGGFRLGCTHGGVISPIGMASGSPPGSASVEWLLSMMEKRRTDHGETPHGRVLSAEEDGLGMRLQESATVADDVALHSSALLPAPSPAESEPPRDTAGTSGRGTMPGPQGMRDASHAMECAEDIETDKNSKFWCSADMLAADSVIPSSRMGQLLAGDAAAWDSFDVTAPCISQMFFRIKHELGMARSFAASGGGTSPDTVTIQLASLRLDSEAVIADALRDNGVGVRAKAMPRILYRLQKISSQEPRLQQHALLAWADISEVHFSYVLRRLKLAQVCVCVTENTHLSIHSVDVSIFLSTDRSIDRSKDGGVDLSVHQPTSRGA